MNEILNEINSYLNVDLLTKDSTVLATVIVTAVIAIIYCFFGYKCIRFIAAVIGLIAGAAAGRIIVQNMNLTHPVSTAVIIGAAVVCALLGALLYRFGIFLIVFLGIWGIAYTVITDYTALDKVFAVIISLAIGVVFAILAAIYARPVVIVMTALEGGLIFSDLLFDYLVHIRWSTQMESLVRLATGLLLAVIGIIYQFASTRDMD